MLPLVANVRFDFRDLRFARRESPITILPGEVLATRESLLHPARGAAFYALKSLAQRNCWRHAQQNMDVVFDAAYQQRVEVVLPRDAPEIAPNSFFDLWRNPTFAIFRAEHDVVMQGGVGVAHRMFRERFVSGRLG